MPKVKVELVHTGKKKKINTSAKTVQSLLDELDLNREVFVVRKNGQIVPEGELLFDGDELEIIKVVSGG